MAVQGFVEVAGYSETDLQNSYNAGYDDCKDDLEEITIQQNGTYNAETLGKVGFDNVIVDVAGGGGGEFAFVEAQVKNTRPMPDGMSRIMSSTYVTLEEAVRVRFYSTLNFNVTLTTSGTPATVTITYSWDDEGSSTPITQTYGAGNQVLTVDFLTPELSAGDHVFNMRLAISGGSLS